MNNRLTVRERAHLARVKELNCSCCGAEGPSDAHHIEQKHAYLCIPLRKECHTGHNGWHGTNALWRVRKMGELDALAVTVQRLMEA